jgi:hypothetical protein
MIPRDPEESAPEDLLASEAAGRVARLVNDRAIRGETMDEIKTNPAPLYSTRWWAWHRAYLNEHC